MTTYRGNRGNLLQHWTLCETLHALMGAFGEATSLHYYSAHAMAPLAGLGKTSQTRRVFEKCQSQLPGVSRYERAWFELVEPSSSSYPSSAAFVSQIWQGPLTLTLCETEPETIEALKEWISSAKVKARVSNANLHAADWRDSPKFTCSDVDLQILEFDPFRFNSNAYQYGNNRGDLYPQDLPIIVKLADSALPTVIFISSYSAQNGNSIARIEQDISDGLEPGGFDLSARVIADGQTVSFLYSRGLALSGLLSALEEGFAEWLSALRD